MWVDWTLNWRLCRMAGCPLLAGWVRSRAAALEHSISERWGSAERLLWRKLTVAFGSGAAVARFAKRSFVIASPSTTVHLHIADRLGTDLQQRHWPSSSRSGSVSRDRSAHKPAARKPIRLLDGRFFAFAEAVSSRSRPSMRWRRPEAMFMNRQRN